MTKDVKYIIAYSILLGFFSTMLLLYGLDMLLAPRYTIDPGFMDPWLTALLGIGGILICIHGIHKRTKKHKP